MLSPGTGEFSMCCPPSTWLRAALPQGLLGEPYTKKRETKVSATCRESWNVEGVWAAGTTQLRVNHLVTIDQFAFSDFSGAHVLSTLGTLLFSFPLWKVALSPGSQGSITLTHVTGFCLIKMVLIKVTDSAFIWNVLFCHPAEGKIRTSLKAARRIQLQCGTLNTHSNCSSLQEPGEKTQEKMWC